MLGRLTSQSRRNGRFEVKKKATHNFFFIRKKGVLILDGFLFFRMAIGFYCLGTLDVTGFAERKITRSDREGWKAWIWDQYVGKFFFLLRLVCVGSKLWSDCLSGGGDDDDDGTKSPFFFFSSRRRFSSWSVIRDRW
jgi:hypothetical protein